MNNRKSTINKSWTFIPRWRNQQLQIDNDHEQNLKDKDNRKKDDNGIIKTMWIEVYRHTKYKSSLGHKIIYNYAMSFLITLIITGLEVLEDPINKQINPWSEHNSILLDRMMMNMWTK